MKIGTVGTNFVVSDFISAAREAGAEITAAYSRKQQTADAFADKHSIEKRYTDRAAFLADTDLDFIYVASPNSLHYEWVKAALTAGRNVICEKPFTSTTAELSELIELARKKELFLFEAITVPHLPNYKLLKSRLADLGEIKIVQFNFSQYSSRYDAYLRGENPNVFNPEFSGGALMDLNYYNINFAVGLFGEPKSVQYYPNLVENGIDTSGVLIMQYDGFVCTSIACKDSRSELVNQIQGTKGYIKIEGASSLCSEFSVCTKENTDTVNEQSQKNVLYYEIVDFKAIFEADDKKKCAEMLEYSRMINRVVETARHSGGVYFPADKRKA